MQSPSLIGQCAPLRGDCASIGPRGAARCGFLALVAGFCGIGNDDETLSLPNGRQTLIIVALVRPFSPGKDQVANTKWHRFTFRTGRAVLPSGQGAADLSPDPFPHIHIMGCGGEKSPFRVRSLD